MKRFVLSALILCFSLHLIASVPFVVSGLQTGDKAVVSISSNEYLSTLEITSNGEYYFENEFLQKRFQLQQRKMIIRHHFLN